MNSIYQGGVKHRFLGIKIYRLENRRVLLFIKDYIDESIEKFGEALHAKVSSPANKYLHNKYIYIYTKIG